MKPYDPAPSLQEDRPKQARDGDVRWVYPALGFVAPGLIVCLERTAGLDNTHNTLILVLLAIPIVLPLLHPVGSVFGRVLLALATLITVGLGLVLAVLVDAWFFGLEGIQ